MTAPNRRLNATTDNDLSRGVSSQPRTVVRYKGKMYDLTNMLDAHPGGREIIETNNGQDITELFDNVNHSNRAKRWMSQFILTDTELTDKKNTVDMSAFQDRQTPAYSEGLRSVIAKKLFTREDRFFLHKCLGILAVFR